MVASLSLTSVEKKAMVMAEFVDAKPGPNYGHRSPSSLDLYAASVLSENCLPWKLDDRVPLIGKRVPLQKLDENAPLAKKRFRRHRLQVIQEDAAVHDMNDALTEMLKNVPVSEFMENVPSSEWKEPVREVSKLESALSELGKGREPFAELRKLEAALSELGKEGITMEELSNLEASLSELSKEGVTMAQLNNLEAALSELSKEEEAAPALSKLEEALSELSKEGEPVAKMRKLEAALSELSKEGVTHPQLSKEEVPVAGLTAITAAVPLQRFQMQWTPSLSLFVLNRVCELVQKGITFHRGIKEHYMTRVSNDVLDFTGLVVTPTQIYNHLRKWKTKWVRVMKLQSTEGTFWCEESSTIMMDDAQLLRHITSYPKDDELLNKPIVNYAQMKTIYARSTPPTKSLFNPATLIRALNHLADNKDEHIRYANMTDADMRSWLRTFLRAEFETPVCFR